MIEARRKVLKTINKGNNMYSCDGRLIPAESTLLGGPVALLCLGDRLGKLGLRESGLGVMRSHLDGDTELGMMRLGGAIIELSTFDCFLLRCFASSASENSLSDVGSHLTVFELLNLFPGLLWRFKNVPFFAKPFAFFSVNSWTIGTSMSLGRLCP